MSDLIERQAAIKALEELISARNKWISDARNETQGLFVAICAIVDVPRAKPAADISEQLENAYAHGYTAAEAEFRKVMETERWIPVSERLPEDFEEVNITWVNRNPPPYYKDIKDEPFTATGVHFHGKWYWWDASIVDELKEYRDLIMCLPIDAGIEITAWKPLPEPYREEKNK